ncbi:MAG: hypothetical protein AB4426_09795 [Xenococcaceae cyanobacterium]
MSDTTQTPIQSHFAPYLKHRGRTPEEQLRLNQPAMEWLKKQMEEELTEEEAREAEEFFERFKEIVDSFRPPGHKLYSEE